MWNWILLLIKYLKIINLIETARHYLFTALHLDELQREVSADERDNDA